MLLTTLLNTGAVRVNAKESVPPVIRATVERTEALSEEAGGSFILREVAESQLAICTLVPSPIRAGQVGLPTAELPAPTKVTLAEPVLG